MTQPTYDELARMLQVVKEDYRQYNEYAEAEIGRLRAAHKADTDALRAHGEWCQYDAGYDAGKAEVERLRAALVTVKRWGDGLKDPEQTYVADVLLVDALAAVDAALNSNAGQQNAPVVPENEGDAP